MALVRQVGFILTCRCLQVKVKVNVDVYSALSWTHL